VRTQAPSRPLTNTAEEKAADRPAVWPSLERCKCLPAIGENAYAVSRDETTDIHSWPGNQHHAEADVGIGEYCEAEKPRS